MTHFLTFVGSSSPYGIVLTKVNAFFFFCFKKLPAVSQSKVYESAETEPEQFNPLAGSIPLHFY